VTSHDIEDYLAPLFPQDCDQITVACCCRVSLFCVSNAIPIIIAMFISKAQVILEIGGAFGGCLIDFAFPGILWVMNSGNHWCDWKNIPAKVLTIFGVFCWITSTGLAIWEAFQ
jgi:hypothetical protein